MRALRIPFVLVAGLALAASDAAQSPCAPLGLELEIAGGTLGKDITVELFGSPGAPGVLGVSTGLAVTPTPFGTFCIDFGGLFAIFSFSLDASGHGVLSGPLKLNPAALGITYHAQALAVDALQPGGVALSDAESYTHAPPRMYVLDLGLATPFGSSLGAVVPYDALAGAVGAAASLADPIAGSLYLPTLEALALLRLDGTVVLLDGGTLATTASLPTSSGFGVPVAMALNDRYDLVVAYGGTMPTPFGGGTPGAVEVRDLPSGALLGSATLSQGHPSALLVAPGTGKAYLDIGGGNVVVVDAETSQELSIAALGGAHGELADWMIHAGRLVALHAGQSGTVPPAISALDLATDQPVFPTPVPLATLGQATLLRSGPTPAGPALLALVPDAGELHAIDPVSLAATSVYSLPPGITGMEPTAGATQWLLLQSGTVDQPFGPPATLGTLYAMQAATFSLGALAVLPAETQIGPFVLSNAVIREAYVLSGGTDLFVVPTDPAVSPGAPLALALPAGGDEVAVPN